MVDAVTPPTAANASPATDLPAGVAFHGTPTPADAPTEPLPSLHIATWLRDAGLQWHPAQGDRFVLPDHEVDMLLMVADMVVEVRQVPAGRIIALNGTPEWAMDSIMFDEALWLPTEGQLRQLLADTFVSLTRDLEGWRVTLRDRSVHVASTAADALGKALLATHQA